MRIDKTTRQKGAPNWLKELLYIDSAENDTKPTNKGNASGEGSARDGESPKANAKRPTDRTDEPKEIADESEGDLGFFSLREIAARARSGVAKTLDQLFSGLHGRSCFRPRMRLRFRIRRCFRLHFRLRLRPCLCSHPRLLPHRQTDQSEFPQSGGPRYRGSQPAPSS